MTLNKMKHTKPMQPKHTPLEHLFYYSYNNEAGKTTQLKFGVHIDYAENMRQMFRILDKMTPDMLKKVIKALKN